MNQPLKCLEWSEKEGTQTMEIIPIGLCDESSLYQNWKEFNTEVPYCFETEKGTWSYYFNNHDGMFKFLDGFTAVDENNKVVGYIQYGLPTFIYNRVGQRVENPQVGVIRHFAFPETREDIGVELFRRTESFLNQFEDYYAFYHALGMPNTAGHGKLFCRTQNYIGDFLLKNGFQIEHENRYYIFSDVLKISPDPAMKLEIQRINELEKINALVNGELVGTATVVLLKDLTGGKTKNIIYLKWIGVHKEFRGQGKGSALLTNIIDHYRGIGYDQIHLDTTLNNEIAQKMYIKHGFEEIGITRSYMKLI